MHKRVPMAAARDLAASRGDCPGAMKTASDGFVTNEDIGPNDVLCGRGKRAYDAAGNVAFRSLAASRKGDYLAAKTPEKKNLIAKEIVDHVRYNTNPPGRFLKLVESSVAVKMGFPGFVDMWCLVDDKTALEKAKMTLRQKQQKPRSGVGDGADEKCIKPTSKGAGEGEQSRTTDNGTFPLKTSAISVVDSGDSLDKPKGAQNMFDMHESPALRPDLVPSHTSTDSGFRGQASGAPSDDAAVNGTLIQCELDESYDIDRCVSHATTSTLGASLDDAVKSQFDDRRAIKAGISHATTPLVPSSADAELNNTLIQKSQSNNITSTRAELVETEKDHNILQDRRDSLLESVRVALDLTRGVREAHDSGVPYGSNVSVSDPILSDDRIRSDLVTLGSVLYQHFSGVSPFHADTIGNDSGDLSEAGAALGDLSTSETTRPTKKKERRHTHRSYIPLRDIGFPVSLCILVSSLIDAQDSDAVDRFETASAAEEDLRLMTVEPHRYLFDADSDKLRGKLEFPEGRLVGRDHHFSNLMGAFDRVMSSGPGGAREMVLVSGYAGTGKSTLVEQLRNPLAKKNGNFVSGKFDELGQVQPLSVIFSAFNEYCNDLVEGDEDKLAEISMAVKDALGSHSNVLTDLIPNLGKILGGSDSSPLHVEGNQALNRFIFYFRLFVRAIASPYHPIVVFLDDLQWADRSSLEFISMLVSDTDMSSLLFIGCYRDNEVGLDHALHAEIEKITAAGVGVATIKLGNIARESVNALISDTLHLTRRLTRSLGDIVFTKTNGNPLFAVQFLRSLCNENLLQYSAHSRRWEWDVDAIQSKDIADNVVDLMMKKMLKLDPGVQWLLKVAASLGSRSDASTLKLLGLNDPSEGSGAPSFLDVAISEGLLCKADSVYKFSHDQIQQAAYSLIPSSERETMHLSIGRLLWSKASSEELKNVIFIIVDQLHRGSELITDHEEKVKAAGLFLMAGEKAMASSSFVPASLYLLQGTVFLDESDWEHNYELSLQLFTLCAEAQYATGAYEGVSITSSPILAHGRCLRDKLRAYCTLLNSFGAQGKQQDTIQYGLSFLAQLGEPFPEEASLDIIMKDFAKTQAVLGNTSFDEIMAKDAMLDSNKIAVMKLLNILTRYTYQANQQLMSLIVFRMVQVTLCHGLCRESSLGFACFGSVLCTFHQLEAGYRYGKLGLTLLEKFGANEYVARVYCIVYGTIFINVEPMQAVLPSLKQGYESGMSTGDIEWAMINADLHARSAIQCGCKLEPLASEVRMYQKQMREHNHPMLTMTAIHLQAILNLIGSPENPAELTGEVMDQQEVLSNALEDQRMHVVSMVYFTRMWLAYFFGRYDIASEMAECCRSIRKSRPFKGGLEAVEIFYAGLVAVAMLRGGHESSEWRSDVAESLEKMKAWAEKSAWNFQHKLHLLNAEISYLNGNLETAANAYNEAIRVAGERGFCHEQALACERAGMFYSEAISTAVATDYFERAHKLHLQWGAKRKADDLLPRVGSAA